MCIRDRLNSTGRIADFASLELANAGVHTENRGIPVDEHFATNVPHIYAIGDVLGRVQLAHLASAQAPVSYTHLDVYKRQG